MGAGFGFDRQTFGFPNNSRKKTHDSSMRKSCVLFVIAALILSAAGLRFFPSVNSSSDMRTDGKFSSDFCGGKVFLSEESVSAEGKPLPAIMYHSVNKANIGDYVVHPSELERDFRNVKKLGFTPIFAREAADFVGKGFPLPEKPILITFDDGFYNNLSFVLPLLKKYGYKAVIAVVGSFTDKEKGQRQSDYYSNLNREQIKLLSESGFVEIADHTYDLHGFKNGRKGVCRKKGESFSAYRELLLKDLAKNGELLLSACGKAPTTFVYPYGAYSADTPEILAEAGFGIALTCNETVSVLKKGCNPYLVGRFNRSGKADSDAFFAKLSREIEKARRRTDS